MYCLFTVYSIYLYNIYIYIYEMPIYLTFDAGRFLQHTWPKPMSSRFREDRSLSRLDAKFWKKMGVLPLLDRLDETGKILPDEPSGKLEEEEQIWEKCWAWSWRFWKVFVPSKNNEEKTNGTIVGVEKHLKIQWFSPQNQQVFGFVGSDIDIPIHFHHVSAADTAIDKSCTSSCREHSMLHIFS